MHGFAGCSLGDHASDHADSARFEPRGSESNLSQTEPPRNRKSRCIGKREARNGSVIRACAVGHHFAAGLDESCTRSSCVPALAVDGEHMQTHSARPGCIRSPPQLQFVTSMLCYAGKRNQCAACVADQCAAVRRIGRGLNDADRAGGVLPPVMSSRSACCTLSFHEAAAGARTEAPAAHAFACSAARSSRSALRRAPISASSSPPACSASL